MMMKGKNGLSWYGQFVSQYVAFPFRVWCTKNLSIDHNMLSRRLVARFPHLNILARASSNAASTPSPLAPATDSSVTSQSPNYPTTWSTNQQPRPAPRSGPRFEHTFMELQPNPLSAMELVANEPVRVVHGRKAVCDGGEQWHTHMILAGSLMIWVGGGPLGHPKIYINLVRGSCISWSCVVSLTCLKDQPGPRPCGYVFHSHSFSLRVDFGICSFSYWYVSVSFIELGLISID